MIDKISAKVALDDIKVGAVVQLASGGPDMVVENLNGTTATCIWFDKTNRLRKDDFEVALLAMGSEVLRAIAIMPRCPACKRYVPADVRWQREQNEGRGVVQ